MLFFQAFHGLTSQKMKVWFSATAVLRKMVYFNKNVLFTMVLNIQVIQMF